MKDLETMKVSELKVLLKCQDLPVSGNKAELIARLAPTLTKSGKIRKRKAEAEPKSAGAARKKPAAKKKKALESPLLGGATPESKLVSSQLTLYLPTPLCSMVMEYVRDHFSRFRKAIRKLPSPWANRDLTAEACLMLRTVEDATRNVAMGKNHSSHRILGWGFKVLHGILKGSRAENCRKANVRSTLGYGSHVNESLWQDILNTLESNQYVVSQYCNGPFGGGYAFTCSERGRRILMDVPTREILAVVNETRDELEAKKRR